MTTLKKSIFASIITIVFAASVYASEGVSPKAYTITDLWGIPITNAMVTSWIVSLFIIAAIRLAIGRNPQIIPTKGQAIVESLVEGIQNLIKPIVGERLVNATFPLLIGLFTFILIQNWSGLIPGIGTFGRIEEGHLIYFLRPATSDINTTIALAIISMACWLYFVLRYAGLKALAFDLFGNKANKKEVPALLYNILFLIFIGVGLIEVVSILVRPVSLSLRLYGNIFGGENLLTSMTDLVGWLIPVPFYFLEVIIGFVQAMVFVMLVSVYIGSICNHEPAEGGHH